MSLGRLGLIQAGQPAKQCPTLAELTADATATASQIAEGATAYVQGEKITGTMPTTIDVAAAGIKLGYSTFEEVPKIFYFSAVIDATNMFRYCGSLVSTFGLDFSSVTITYATFYQCISLESVSGLNLSSVTNARAMFSGCTSLKSVSGLDFSSVTNAQDMFSGCTSLESVSGLDFSSVTNALSMFSGCTSLKSVSGFDFSSVTNAQAMFSRCSNLDSFKNTSTIRRNLSFKDSPLLNPTDAESSILGMLADLTGKTSQTITFNTALQSSISESAIQAATDKNWVVNFADSI